MPAWSNGTYQTQNRMLARIYPEVTIRCAKMVESKDRALEAIAEQEGLVKEHEGQHF
jgi:hypothetical protein